MPLVAFAAGQKLSASDLNTAFDWDYEKYQSADQSVTNSTTLVSSNDLVAPVVANGIYVVRMYLVYDCNSTADFKYQLTLPASGVVVKHSRWANAAADAAINSAVNHDSQDVTTYNLGGVAAGTIMTALPRAIIALGATAGNCTLQFAQAVSNGTATILKAGSVMNLRRVA